MKILKISPFYLFQYKFLGKIPKLDDGYLLAADDYFDIGFGYFENNIPIKEVYIPLELGSYPISESFSLIEIIKKGEKYLIRSRISGNVKGLEIEPKHFNQILKEHARFYTTFSIEKEYFNYPFQKISENGFSVIHFCHEAVKGGGLLKNIVIIADPGKNLNYAYQEGVEIFNFIKELHADINVSFISYPLSSDEFDRIICDASIIHFCGHIDEKGIFLGKEYYTPHMSTKKLAPLIFFNGCRLPEDILIEFIKRKAKNIIFSIKENQDNIDNIEKLKYFYLGIFLGHRIGDVSRKTLDFNKIRLYGWMTNRFTF